MTTIREFLTDDAQDMDFDEELYSDDYVNVDWMLAQFGIGPEWPEDSIVVTRRPECPTCAGGGTVAMADPDLSHEDVPEVCDTCQGTGYVPDPWVDVDGCLTWLHERRYLVLVNVGRPPAMVSIRRSRDDVFQEFEAVTLHPALIDACKAVQEQQ